MSNDNDGGDDCHDDDVGDSAQQNDSGQAHLESEHGRPPVFFYSLRVNHACPVGLQLCIFQHKNALKSCRLWEQNSVEKVREGEVL